MKISVQRLQNEVSNLKATIDEYENIKLNLYNQFKDVTNNWNDGYTIQYTDKTYNDKKEIDEFFNNIVDLKNAYEFIANKYASIGNEITANINSRSSLINSVDYCISSVNSILREFDNINMSFSYPEKYQIINQRNKFATILNNLNDAKNTIHNFFNTVEANEREIKKKISSLNIKEISELRTENMGV